MTEQNTNDAMLDMFLYESSQLIEQLEMSILTSDEERCYTEAAINEIFRIMHTIKGSAAMMKFHEISDLTHTIEDLFFYLRDEKPKQINCSSLSDLILESVDFIKVELMKIKNHDNADGNASYLIESLKEFLRILKDTNLANPDIPEQLGDYDYNQFYVNCCQSSLSSYCNTYKAVLFFEEGCEMENVRAFTVIHKLKEVTECYAYFPNDILDSINKIIRENKYLYQNE